MRRLALVLGLILTGLVGIGNVAAPAPTSAPVTTNNIAMEIDRRAADLELRKAIVDAQAAVEAASHSRLEVIGGWLGAVVGLFGILITGVIIFFAFNTRALAAAEARKEIADEKEKIARAVAEASLAVAEAAANLEQAKAKVTEIETHRVRVASITREVEDTAATVLAGGKPPAEAVEELKLASDAIESNPLREWSEGDFRIRIGAAATRDDARQALDLAIAMRQLFPEDRAQAFALFAEGWALGALGKSEEEIAVYDDVAARFGNSDDLSLREWVAKALFNKGVAIDTLSKFEEAIAVYEDVVVRFGESADLSLREPVANSLVNKGVALGALGKSEEEIAAYDDVVVRFGESADLSLREQVAKALVYKGITLGALGKSEEEIAVHDNVIGRFGKSDELSLRVWVAKSLFNRACAFARTANPGPAIDNLRQWSERQGGFDCEEVANDRDFNPIRGDPAFVALLEEMGCNAASPSD